LYDIDRIEPAAKLRREPSANNFPKYRLVRYENLFRGGDIPIAELFK
jgi:hypothetical protein